jgi:hypothetical protein
MTKQLKIIYHGCVLCGFCYCVIYVLPHINIRPWRQKGIGRYGASNSFE